MSGFVNVFDSIDLGPRSLVPSPKEVLECLTLRTRWRQKIAGKFPSKFRVGRGRARRNGLLQGKTTLSGLPIWMTRFDHTDFQTDQMAARLAWMLDIGAMIVVSYSEVHGSSVMKAGGLVIRS